MVCQGYLGKCFAHIEIVHKILYRFDRPASRIAYKDVWAVIILLAISDTIAFLVFSLSLAVPLISNFGYLD